MQAHLLLVMPSTCCSQTLTLTVNDDPTYGRVPIAQEACHEANAGPWVRLAEETGAALVWWRFRDGPTAESALSDLAGLLTPRCAGSICLASS